MKYIIFFVIFVSTLSSCTLPWSKTKTDFSSLYNAHVTSQIHEMKDIAKKFGYMGKYETTGSIRAIMDIPTILSGSAYAGYKGEIEAYGLSQDSHITFNNPKVTYETLLASGSLFAKEVSVISRSGDMYLKYDGVDGVEIIDTAMKDIFTKYNNTWLALTEKNLLETLSGASEEEKITYQLSQSLGKLKLEDVEFYMTKYPIWKEVKSLGNIDGKEAFEVELGSENLLALVEEFHQKSTGKGLSETLKKELENSLLSKKVHGTVSFDPNNPKICKTDITISSADGNTMSLILDETATGWDFSTTASGSTLMASLFEKEGDYAFKLLMKDGEIEAFKIEGNAVFKDSKFSDLTLNFSSEENGLSMSLAHHISPDGIFTGSLDAGMGNLSWNGKISKEYSLENLHIKGAMMGSSLTLDLTPNTADMLKGLLLIKSGEDTILEATVGLTLNKEKIHLLLDIPNPATPEISSHAEIEVTGKKSHWNGNIEIPQNTTPFSEVSEALRALAPKDNWDEALSDTQDNESISDDTELSDVATISGTILQ